MSKTLTRIGSYRMTDEDWADLEKRAKEEGCTSVSEYIRRKVNEDPSEGMRGVIYALYEIGISTLAHLNVIMDACGLEPDGRQELINRYKPPITEKINILIGRVSDADGV